ncbi:hypothetical protein DFH28DRAFT_968822 [Melampsora americana]|nr:hypothetical protein DFH28DRAFT_968822 [Melampsora americana]
MPSSRISTKRLHILYTIPLLLGLGSFFLIWIPIFGLVPFKLKSTTVLIIEHLITSDNSNHSFNNDLIAPTLYFGLLGSCYQANNSSPLECTNLSFPADYKTTISRPAWVCHSIGSLPLYFPNHLNHLRFISKPFFSASLWILGIGWALGFSAVLSLACFIQGFSDEYNQFSTLFILNSSHSGQIFSFFIPPMFFQIFIILSLLISIENAPTKNKEAFADSWSHHLGIHSP